MIVIGLIVLIFLALVYVALPLWAKILVFIINAFFPDPIPVLDEVLMLASMINDILKMYKIMMVIEWMQEHKILLIRIGIGIGLFIIFIVILNRCS